MSAELSLSLSARTCKHPECVKPSGMFGVCADHEPCHIRRLFKDAVKIGAAEDEKPGCFRDQPEWHGYIAASMLTGHASRGVRSHISYCRDCTPAYKAEMMECGRCQHAETVFVREEGGDVVGVPLGRSKRSRAWEYAVMGMSGQVVSMPPEEEVGRVLDKLAQRNPVGRPRLKPKDDGA